MSDKLTESQIELLKAPMKVYTRKGPSNVSYPYLKGEDVIARLNDVFDHAWSSEVTPVSVTDTWIVVKASISYGGITKEAFGGSAILMKRDTKEPVDLGNSYKSAAINGLKKAAEQFGIGLDASASPPKRSYDEDRSYTGRATGTSTTATATGTVRVAEPKAEAPKAEPDAMAAAVARAKALAKESTASAPPAPVAPPPATSAAPSEDEKLAAALSALGKMKSGEEPAPAAPPAEETTEFASANPFAASYESKTSDIQINAIKKLCEKHGMTESQGIELCVSLGKIEKTEATSAEELSRKEAAAIIRHLTVME